MNFYATKTTKNHKDDWAGRKIDWDKSYRQTWKHPHRAVICAGLRLFDWVSIFEIGCGGGANLIKIIKEFPNRQIGGIDFNKDAIELCQKTFKGGIFKVGSGDDVMLSDKSTDVVLSDMTLIYVSPFKIKDYLLEMKRLGRNYIVLCEFYSISFLSRLKLKIKTGYFAHNYKRLLEKIGCYDIMEYKLKPEDWPDENGIGHDPQKTYAYLIIARIPRK